MKCLRVARIMNPLNISRMNDMMTDELMIPTFGLEISPRQHPFRNYHFLNIEILKRDIFGGDE